MIEIGLFLTELFKKLKNVSVFWDTMYVHVCVYVGLALSLSVLCRSFYSILARHSMFSRLYEWVILSIVANLASTVAGILLFGA